jgi:short-subunit dehydrogenase
LRSDLNDVIDITMVYPGFIKTPMTDQNDFSMPFLMSADKAASIILKKAERRPLTIAFPLRLHMLLQFMKLFPRLWYSRVSGSLRRTSGAKA